MEKKIMDDYIKEFMVKNKKPQDTNTMANLFTGKRKYSFIFQRAYEDPDCLEVNFRNSVMSIRNENGKDAAIRVYKHFYEFLKEKGISAKVEFPPSDNIGRYLYIAKFLHDSDQKIDDLPDKLWFSKRAIEDYITKLRGLDYDPLEICGKIFKIPETKRSKKRIYSASTVHPLLLTLNLTQVIVMLKGLKKMSENRLYAEYARTAAADIWEQLSDYAKNRIRYVLSERLPEDLTWYENLEKSNNNLFSSEQDCSDDHDVILYCGKNEKSFYLEMQDGDKTQHYYDCILISWPNDSDIFTIRCEQGEKTLSIKNIIRNSYPKKGLL